jgi:hypothetical protein
MGRDLKGAQRRVWGVAVPGRHLQESSEDAAAPTHPRAVVGQGACLPGRESPPNPGPHGSYRPTRTARPAARRPTSAPCRPRPGPARDPRCPSQLSRHVPAPAGSHGCGACQEPREGTGRGGAGRAAGGGARSAPPLGAREGRGGVCGRPAKWRGRGSQSWEEPLDAQGMRNRGQPWCPQGWGGRVPAG